MIHHKAKFVLAALGISSALSLTACGADNYDCGNSEVKDTVISIVRSPDELFAFLMKTDKIAETGLFIGKWYSTTVAAKPWSQRKPEIEAEVAKLSEQIAGFETRQKRAADIKRRLTDAQEACDAERADQMAAYKAGRSPPVPGVRQGPPSKCETLREMEANASVEVLNLSFLNSEIAARKNQLQSLRHELAAEHPSPPQIGDLIDLKFSQISELDYLTEQKTRFCEARIAVKIRYPAQKDLGVVHLLYKIQPNLAKAGDATISVAYP